MPAEKENAKSNTTRERALDATALALSLILALALRLPGLSVFLTADEARSWFGRSLIFLYSLATANLANTGPGGEVPFIENVSLSPAPGVTTMWTGALGILIEYSRQGFPGPLANFIVSIPFDPLDPAMLVWLRLPNVLLAAVAVGLTFWWSRPLLGRWGALLAAAFVALDPFYLALSRVLGHDALVTTFMWLSLVALMRVLIPGTPTSAARRQTGFLILSGVAAGLAFLSKYPALFMAAFTALALLLGYLSHTPRRAIGPTLNRWLKDVLVWSLAAGVTFVLVWPAMWVDPLGPLTAIFNDALRASGSAHQKGSFFLGEPVPDPGTLFYPLILILRTTPLVLFGLLLSLVGLLLPARDETQRRTDRTLFLTLACYTIFYTLLVTYGGKKQDRYLLPAFPAVMMLAALGYRQVSRLSLSRIRNNRFLKAVLPAAYGLLIVGQLISVAPHFPYYFSYYNPLAGGGAAAVDLVQVGWGEGLNEAADYLNSLPEAESQRVVSWYSTTFEPYFEGEAIYKLEDEKISRSAKPGLAADYVVFYVNQTQRHLPSDGALQYFRVNPPVYTVTMRGVDYAWIYPSIGMDFVIPTEVRLVGQAELLGFNLTTESGEPTTVAYPESVVFLSLFWEWQGKAEDEVIGISLLDEAGNTRGWGNFIESKAPVPFAEWQEGMIVQDDFALVVFPDTPPGEYRLAAWIDRPATGETVGVFPLEDKVKLKIVPRE